MGPGDRTKSGFPAAELPAKAREVAAPAARQVPQSLVAKLIPIVDKARQLAVNIGIRPYRCYLVHLGWTGAERGRGQVRKLSRVEIEPMPRVRNMDGVTEVLTSTGLTEQGGLIVDRISAKFTEDDLMGRRMPEMADQQFPRTNADDREFYWEIQENRPSDPPPPIRRFRPIAAPMLSRAGMEWSIQLAKVDYDPDRDGGLDRQIEAN